MSILNGFLRGAHDPEITANIDQKIYSGVATFMKNWVGTKRGALSKRAPFVFQKTLSGDSVILGFNYDDDEKYLLRFFEDSSGVSHCEKYQYINESLVYKGQIGLNESGSGAAFRQPTYTSNTAPQDTISDNAVSGSTSSTTCYERFNTYGNNNKAALWCQQPQMPNGRKINYQLVIEFDTPTNINTVRYIYGSRRAFYQTTSQDSSDYWAVVKIEGSLDGGSWTTLKTINNPVPTGRGSYYQNTGIEIISDTYWKYYRFTPSNLTGTNGTPSGAMFGQIKMTGWEQGTEGEFVSPITFDQAKTMNWFNGYRRAWFVHPDFRPYELQQSFLQPTYAGLNFTDLGNPTQVRVFQQRLVFAAFKNAPRQINLSESANYSTFTLPGTTVLSTSAIQGQVDEMKNKVSALFNGRQMLYIQSADGLGSLNSGADDVPLTATMIAARLRNETPLSATIQPIRQDEIVYCVGADNKTVYALDYDYQYARIPLAPLNEHCITYFDAGIKQMLSMKGKLPYLVFLLNDGTLLFAVAYRSDTSFSFHLFPLEHADGNISSITVLRNNMTGYDTLFAIVNHTNGTTNLESLESYSDFYSKEKGNEYFKSHILLDTKQHIKNDFYYTGANFRYYGIKDAATGRIRLDGYYLSQYLPSFSTKDEMQLMFGSKIYTFKNIRTTESPDPSITFVWADASEEPPLTQTSGGQAYARTSQIRFPRKTITAPQYIGLGAQVFDGDDFVKTASEDAEAGTITLERAIYEGDIGLPYVARAEFENLIGAEAAQQKKVVESIAACITYGTGLKVGTESVLEAVGFANYDFKTWQDSILPDENLRTRPIKDKSRKDKKIVIECDYAFPANITFISYNIKATGVS